MRSNYPRGEEIPLESIVSSKDFLDYSRYNHISRMAPVNYILETPEVREFFIGGEPHYTVEDGHHRIRYWGQTRKSIECEIKGPEHNPPDNLVNIMDVPFFNPAREQALDYRLLCAAGRILNSFIDSTIHGIQRLYYRL